MLDKKQDNICNSKLVDGLVGVCNLPLSYDYIRTSIHDVILESARFHYVYIHQAFQRRMPILPVIIYGLCIHYKAGVYYGQWGIIRLIPMLRH